MVLTKLNLVFKFVVDGFGYIGHVTLETMKCFGCGAAQRKELRASQILLQPVKKFSLI